MSPDWPDLTKLSEGEMWVLFPDAGEAGIGEETIPVANEGPRQWRLLASPITSKMATYGDVVEGEVNSEGILVVERVVKKSGHVKTCHLVGAHFFESEAGRGFLAEVIESDGYWEQVFSGFLILNLPRGKTRDFQQSLELACASLRKD
jgi:hypothetical protein